MKRPPIESAGAFRARYLARGAVPGLLGSLMIVGYFAGTLDLGPEGWRAFGYSMLGLIAITTPYGQWLQRRIDRPITHALERIAAGKQTHEDMRNAYVAARELPRRAMLGQISNYVFATFLVPLWMAISVPDTGAFALIVLAMASISGGAATIPFSLFAMQRFVDSTRDYFAAQLSPEERQALAPPRSLTAKLALPVLASSLAAITFLVLLGYSVAIRLLEQQDVRAKAAFLESATEWLDSGRATPEKVVEVARKRGVATDVEIVAVAGGDASALGLSAREIDWIRGAVHGRTSSLGLDSAASFAWRPLAGEPRRVLVAASPVHDLAGDMTDTLLVVIAVLLGISGVSLGVALLAGADVRRTAERLRAEAVRVGAGDLTGGAVIESEDELGAVAHAFAAMKQKLGATLQRIAETASRVEGAAGELTEIGGAVRQVTAAQVSGIEQVSSAVSVVDRQATEITTSAQTLIGSVEEASSSVLELGAASEELNQTTIALGTQVEAVGSSIEEMVRSLAQTSEATEALGSSVVDTSSSVAEMARSMQSVDAHAWETARLSTRVIELAEGGRDRVKETIAGMEVIRDATDSANRVIGGLSSRMHEIGAIVDVIDEVADETNLLALNAAIIAAQAGDQGRAFSVVADEIKDLADRVLANTKEIGGLIRSVQGEAAAAADAIRSGAESVQGGVDLSAQAGVALEEITSAARHAGERIQEIVHAMREQTRAASHVEQLIEGVGTRVEQIKNAGREQGRGNEVVMRGSLVMRDVAAQTQRTTEEQSRGALRIRDSIEGVRDAVDRIHVSLQHQSTSCRSASEALGAVIERTRSNDEATDRLSRAGATLQELAEKLREDMRKFRIA